METKTNQTNNKTVIVTYQETTHTNERLRTFDDAESKYYQEAGTTTSKIYNKRMKACCAAEIFKTEDGDGDETGSWERGILLITDTKGIVLYDASDVARRERKQDFQETMQRKPYSEIDAEAKFDMDYGFFGIDPCRACRSRDFKADDKGLVCLNCGLTVGDAPTATAKVD